MDKVHSFLERGYQWLVPTLAAVIPFFIVPAPWMSVAQSKMVLIAVFVSIGAVLWAYFSIRRGEIRVPKSWIPAVMVLLPGAYLISSLVSKGDQNSFVGDGAVLGTLAASTILFGLFALSLDSLSDSARSLARLIRGIFIGAVILLIYQIAHLVFPTALSFGGALPGDTASPIANWHDLGIFLGLIVILSELFYGSSLASSRWRPVFIASGALSVFFLVIVNSVDVWWAVAISIGLLLAIRLWDRRGREAVPFYSMLKAEWMALVLVLIAVFFALFGGPVHDLLPPQVRIVQVEVRPSWQATFIVGKSALDAPGQLIFGSGPNTFVQEWHQHKPLDVNETPFWNVDFNTGVGSIPTSFVEIGLLGVIAWAAVLIALLWSTIRFFSMTLEERLRVWLQRGILVGTLYLFAFYFLYTPGIALAALAFILLGAYVASGIRGTDDRYIWRIGSEDIWSIGRFIAVLVCALLIIAASVAIMRVILSDLLVNRSVVAYQKTGDIGAANSLISAALQVSPANDRAHRAAIELGMLQLQQLLSNGGTDEQAKTQLQDTLTRTIEHGLSAVTLNGADYQNWLSLAQVYSDLAGQKIPNAYENAKAAYERAFQTNMTNPLPLLRLAQLELIAGNVQQAHQYLAQAVTVKRDFAAAYYLDSQINASQKNWEAAIAEAAHAAELSQSDPLGWYNLGTISYAAGDYANAKLAFQNAIALKNDYSNGLYMLSLTLYQLKDTQGAIAAMQRVKELNPDSSEAAQALQALQAGKSPSPQAQPSPKR